MFLLLTYDIEGTKKTDKRRLHDVAKICKNYGIRVQNSVFELSVDAKQLAALKAELMNKICDTDSIRMYKLGNTYKTDITVLGKNNFIEIKNDKAIIF